MKMYSIVQHMCSSGIDVTLYETSDPAEAYEMANAWDAHVHLGESEDSKVLEHDKNSLVFILDEDGNDCWHECCEARCPSVSLFNNLG
jgi:hypothetical protein